MSDVYNTIANRLFMRHQILIGEHIQTIKKISHDIGEGISFIPKDHLRLQALLRTPLFAKDNRSHFCDAVAALATKGEGYREVGVPSLHCAISSGFCNIHLDSFGFVAIGPDGKKYYNPDLVQHIVDELGWASVIGWVSKRNPLIGGVLGGLHPILPNSRNSYKPAIGVKFDLIKGNGWSLAVEATRSIEQEDILLGKVEVLNW